jgi:hypothetical protein
LLLAVPSQARAVYDPVGSGTVKLRFDAGFVNFLRSNGIELEATKPARLAGRTLSLPVIGGTVDPTVGKGRADVDGAFLLRSERKRIRFRRVSVRTKHSPLIARVGGGQLKVATASKVSSAREGFDTTIGTSLLRLSSKVATRLNKKLRPPDPFFPGQAIGTVRARVVPLTTTILERERIALQLDPVFVSKLNELFVSVNPIFPTERSGGIISSPILATSALSLSGDLGTVKAAGDIEFLQLHSNGQIFIHEPWLDFGTHIQSTELNLQPSPPFQGKLGRVPAFSLGVGSIVPDPASRSIAVGSQLTLSPETATAFNQVFGEGTQPFAAGDTVGSLAFTAFAQ